MVAAGVGKRVIELQAMARRMAKVIKIARLILNRVFMF